MSPDGYISITGRIKDLIIRGGENIHPLEIENCLLANNAVADVSVVGVPDPRYGEAVAAFVVPRDQGPNAITAEAVQQWVREELSSHLGKLLSLARLLIFSRIVLFESTTVLHSELVSDCLQFRSMSSSWGPWSLSLRQQAEKFRSSSSGKRPLTFWPRVLHDWRAYLHVWLGEPAQILYGRLPGVAIWPITLKRIAQ
jgi:hypothetical protein